MRTIKEWRAARGLSIRRLAEEAGVSHRTVYLADAGRQQPSVKLMWKIAAALGTAPLEIAEFHKAITERGEE